MRPASEPPGWRAAGSGWVSSPRAPVVVEVGRHPLADVTVGLLEVAPAGASASGHLDVLSPGERRIAESFSSTVRRDEYVTSRWLMRFVLAGLLGTSPQDVLLRETVGSGPSVAAPLDISLSHSMGLTAVAVTRRGRVGIDIEAEGDHLLALCRRFVPSTTTLTPREATLRWARWEARRKVGNVVASLSDHVVETSDGRTFALALALTD